MKKLKGVRRVVIEGKAMFCQGEGETESSEAFLVGNGGIKELDVHGKDEAMRALELKVIEVLESMWGVFYIGWKGQDQGEMGKREINYMVCTMGQEQQKQCDCQGNNACWIYEGDRNMHCGVGEL